MTERLRVAILGSTGSIGKQALDVAAQHPERIQVVALAARSNADMLIEQARRFQVPCVALADENAAIRANTLRNVDDPFPRIDSGSGAVAALAALDDADIVLNALVGAAGLRATWTALESGKTLALANKESLVIGGELIMPKVAPQQMIPVDSEHSAIFQCLLGEPRSDVARIWLTASGGPFRGRTRAQLVGVTAADALAHPTWTMGAKISIDSATLMNKGLEVIEAHHLFGVSYDDVRVVVHPQSIVHSMVEYRDGSVKAHLGATDMRVPIQYAFSHPRRWAAPVEPADFTKLAALEFLDPDPATFGCLRLALEAGRAGGTAPAVLNAANEIAVESFLAGKIEFLGIERLVESTLDRFGSEPLDSLDQLEDVDTRAREMARSLLPGN